MFTSSVIFIITILPVIETVWIYDLEIPVIYIHFTVTIHLCVNAPLPHPATSLISVSRQRLVTVITISRLLSSAAAFKNFKVALYSKRILGINMKLGILAHQDKSQLQDKGHDSEIYAPL